MQKWIAQTAFVTNLANSILAPKQQFYREHFLQYKLLQLPHLKMQNFHPINEFQQTIEATLICNATQPTEYCLIFLHGYSSNRLQAITLLDELPENLAMCCFDFSGSGKSQGNLTSFGIKEYKDIKCVIEALKKLYSYKKFILWGRSMGAVASLLKTCHQPDQDIIFQVLDSPFSSFQSICTHHAKTTLTLPHMFISTGLSILKTALSSNQFNPFQINFDLIGQKCQTPTLFVYNENDEVIPAQHMQQILNKFNKECSYEKMMIREEHNNLRGGQTLKQIFQVVRKYLQQGTLRKDRSSKKKMIEVYSSFLKKSSYTPTNGISMSKTRSSMKSALFCSLSKKHPSSTSTIAKISSIEQIKHKMRLINNSHHSNPQCGH